MLQALIDGQRDPAVLAELAKRRLRAKIPELTEALTGRFTEHHAFLAGMHLDPIDQRSRHIAELTARIEVVIEPFRGFRDLIGTIPGIGDDVAEVIIAETGADMSRLPHRRRTWRPGPGSARAATSPPAGSSPPRPGPATPTSRRARHRRDVRREQPRHLPRRQVPAHRRPPRTQESHSSRSSTPS